MSSNTNREQSLIQNVIESFHCFVDSRIIKNNFSIFCIKQFERLIYCENSQISFFVNDNFFKCFIIVIYIVDHELNQNFENNFWYCSSNKSFDVIIYNNHNSFVFCFDNKQKIDEIQISFLKWLIFIKLCIWRIHYISFDFFRFNSQLIFFAISYKFFDIFTHVKASLSNTNDI